ncbi:hypothetical protein [uncultured Dokdonia sp.]|uniref:hypothetical protein n=1 Tax=uncultured Dokdonia sp. TaxID=575653 RepID=UPI0026353B9C|nr:hypothetical protein [uncultured Dokdonia sp.]
MKKLLLIAILLVCSIATAQVGIGTTTPNAALDIQSPSDDLPALKLNPQSNPIGTAAGQISVIGDRLFLYDATRNKWLSIETSIFSFGDEGNINSGNLEYAGDIRDSGPRITEKASIVYLTMNSTSGNQDKRISINITDASGTVTEHEFQLVNGSLILENLDIEVESGDFIQISAVDGGGPIRGLSATIWTKFRN